MAVLSITRTVKILNRGRITKKIVMIIIAYYAAFLLIHRIVALIFGYAEYVYTPAAGYCWSKERVDWYHDFEITVKTIVLTAPILPIIISCLISTTYIIIYGKNLSEQVGTGNGILRRSTITILIFTVAYIIFNVPVFINFVLYTTVVVNHYP